MCGIIKICKNSPYKGSLNSLISEGVFNGEIWLKEFIPMHIENRICILSDTLSQQTGQNLSAAGIRAMTAERHERSGTSEMSDRNRYGDDMLRR